MEFQDLIQMEEKRIEIVKKHLENGVLFVDYKTAYIDESVVIGSGTKIHPNVFLEGSTEIAENCVIGSGTKIVDSKVGARTKIEASHIHESLIGEDTSIGPFAYLRPKSNIGNGCKVGDFVEVKNSSMGNGSKASHLAYIGDADVGEKVNIGCGVVFVNYDGKNKHRSKIGDGAFLGCNVNIVSPTEVEEKAYVAAGTTVTSVVPTGALCVGRAKAKIIEGWVSKRGLLNKE